MRRTTLAYGLAAVTTSVGALRADDRLHAISKHLVAPLAVADIATRPGARMPARRARTATLAAALLGSAVGDHLMLAESRASGAEASLHLRRGAAAFAVQQLGFLTVLHERGIRPSRRDVRRGALALAALGLLDAATAASLPPPPHATATSSPEGLVSTTSLTDALPPQLPSALPQLPDPVVAGYGMLLVTMSVLAQHDPRTALGGRMFLASDAVIVARRALPHGRARRAADAVVMTTYTAALGLLVHGLADDAAAD